MLTIVISAFAVGALSMPTGTQSAEENCANRATEAALLACRQQEFRDQSAKIAALNLKLTKRASNEPPLAAALKMADARWQAYRDAECHVATWESARGSATEVYRLSCLTSLGALRVQVLEERVDNP